MKKIILMAITSGMLILSGSAHAAGSYNLDTEGKLFYAGISASAIGVENSPTTGTKGSSTKYGAVARTGIQFNDHLATEIRAGGAFDRGSVSAPSPRSYFSLLLVPQMDVAQNLFMYGLIGMSTVSMHRGSVTSSDTRTGASYGGGLEYKFMNAGYFQVEWHRVAQRINLPSNATVPSSKVSIDAYNIGLNIRF